MILVTGGAGFIGFHVIQKLFDMGEEILCIDNLNNYYDPELKQSRLQRIADRMTFIQADISNRAALEEVFRKYPITSICHLAAQAGVRYSLEHPNVYVSTNYVGTFNIIDLAKKYEVNHIVAASTSSVYGGSTTLPFTEDDPADKPLSMYAATKRATELLGYNYHYLYDMNSTFLRFFTVYGPWGRPDMALFLFTKSILSGDPIDVYNKGDMWRDFTYVDDIASGIVQALNHPNEFQIYNLGCGNPVHLMTFIATLENTLGREVKKNYLPMQQGDVHKTWADISRAEEELGFTPQTHIEEGIQNFVEWYREYYE
ncbi:MAG: SDR family NAD(P)-dependent oxidoreductase [Salinispira sp.]